MALGPKQRRYTVSPQRTLCHARMAVGGFGSTLVQATEASRLDAWPLTLVHMRHSRGSRTTRHKPSFPYQAQGIADDAVVNPWRLLCRSRPRVSQIRPCATARAQCAVHWQPAGHTSVKSCAGTHRRSRASQTMCKILLLNFFWSLACMLVTSRPRVSWIRP